MNLKEELSKQGELLTRVKWITTAARPVQPLKALCTTSARLRLTTRCELASDTGTRDPSVDAEIPTNKPSLH